MATVVSARDQAIRRIVLALDASSDPLAILEAAVMLAARHRAELEAVFVEDADILCVAELPFVRQVNPTTGRPMALDAAAVERELRLIAGRTRRALEARARAMHVTWSFSVVRGRSRQAVPEAATRADLVVFGAPNRSLIRALSAGCSTRTAVGLCARSVLLINPERLGLVPGVLVAVMETPGDTQVLEVAARLAAADGGRLLAVGCGATPEAARRLAQEAREWLAARGIDGEVREVVAGSAALLARRIREDLGTGSGTTVIDAGSPLLAERRALSMFENAGGAVLLVRK